MPTRMPTMGGPAQESTASLRKKRILLIRSSLTPEKSYSNKGVDRVVYELRMMYTATPIEIIERDLARMPVPLLTEETNSAVRFRMDDDPQKVAAIKLADQLVAELQQADFIIIGLPRYNLGPPAHFKSYIDYIVRPNVTFSYSGGAPRGLLEDKPTFVVMSSGGAYGYDYFYEWVREILAFIGLNDVTFLPFEGIAVDPEAAETEFVATLHAAMDKLQQQNYGN